MVMQLHCPGEGDDRAPAVVMSAARPLAPQLQWLAAAAARAPWAGKVTTNPRAA